MRILITGANRGLGLSLVKMGVKRGHTIVAGVRNIDKIDQLSSLRADFPDLISIIPLDVTEEDSVYQASKTVERDFGSIDVIINNAGVLLERDRSIEQLDFNNVQTSFDVNLFGPMKVVKHFLPLLYKGKEQSIINISSEAGSFKGAYGGDYPYAISKAALNMFTEQLRSYVKQRNIEVFSLHPGWIKTDMGGEKAPGNPTETADGIFDIIERKLIVKSEHAFINHKGNSMPI